MATEVELVKLSALTTITTDLAALTEADRIQTGLDVLATNVAKEAAEAAASVSGDVNFYDTYADASAAVSGLTAGDIVEVIADETLSNLRTRYRVETGSLAFKLLLSPIVVGTTANLRAIPYSGALAQAQTLGSLADDDNGGGAWRWDAASTADDNVGTVIKPTGHSGPGRWMRNYSGPINLNWFTAPAESNIAAAFKAAIAWALDNSDELYVPSGTWNYTDTETHFIQLWNADGTTKTLKIFGDGASRTIINVDCPGIAFDVSGQAAGPLQLEKLTIKNAAPTVAGRTGFRVWARSPYEASLGRGRHGARFWLDETIISGFTYTGIWGIANLNSGGRQAFLTGPAGYPSSTPPTHPATHSGGTVETYSLDSAGIRLWGGSGPPDTDIAQQLFFSNLINFQQCFFTNCRTGLEVIGSKVTLDTCIVEYNWLGVVASGGLASDLTGVSEYPAWVTFKNCWFEYNYKYHWSHVKVDYATGADVVSAALVGRFTVYDQEEQQIVSGHSSQVRTDGYYFGLTTALVIANNGLRIAPKTYNGGVRGAAPLQLGGNTGLNVWLDGSDRPKWKIGTPATADDGVFLNLKTTFTPKLMIGATESASGSGTYVRIGNMVFFTILFSVADWTKGSATGDLTITGLPVACGENYGTAHINASNFINTVNLPTGRIASPATKINMFLNETGLVKGFSTVNDTHLQAGPITLAFYVSGSYITA